MGLQFDAKTGLPLQLCCGAWEKPAGHLQGIAMFIAKVGQQVQHDHHPSME